jgi:SWIM zinc finger
MIEREREVGALKETFKILGSTGNVYTVTISHIPSCSCPDATKGNHCKHLIFVFLKVLSVPESSTFFYQKYAYFRRCGKS